MIAISILGIPAQGDAAQEASVRARLRGWFGSTVDGWCHLKTFRIPDALPPQTPPVENPRLREARRTDGLYVCGEYRSAPTINWALYSGQRAAEAVAAAGDERPSLA